VVAMSTWDQLKVALIQLRDGNPGALQSYPTPEVDEGRTPPFRIQLSPWATRVATELHERFGDDVDLEVGFLHFPERTLVHPDLVGRQAPPLAPADVVEPSLIDPLVVSSGHSGNGQLILLNHTGKGVTIVTTGQLFASVVDPDTHQVVGGYAGGHRLSRVVFSISPGERNTIPLCVGTASVVPELGYAVPAGRWAIAPRLEIEGRGWFRTSQLPITVVN
jgi:hypothetical protein